MTDSTTPRASKKLMPALVSVRRMTSHVPAAYFNHAELEKAANQSLALGGFYNPPVVRRDGENFRVITGHFEFHAATIAKTIDPWSGEIIPAFIVEDEISQIPQTVAVDCEKLEIARNEIRDLVDGLATLERAFFNLEACERFWESAELSHEQILDRLQYLHDRFWNELPEAALASLNQRTINLNRMLRNLGDFEVRWTTPIGPRS